MTESETDKKIALMVHEALILGSPEKLRKLATLLNLRASFEETILDFNNPVPKHNK